MKDWFHAGSVRFHRPRLTGLIRHALTTFIIFTALSSPSQPEVLSLEQWIDLGWDYYNTGNIDEAFNTFLETVDRFPDSAEAHLALGEIYLEMGITDRGRAELLASLQLDDESPLATRAHYDYALSIREEDTWLALLHLNRAHELEASPNLHLEIGHQIRFCNLLLQMTGRSQSGSVVLHYPNYMLSASTADTMARDAEASLYLAESFCYYNIAQPVHFFLYASERAVRAEVRVEDDDSDPAHREHHNVYSPDLDFLPCLCAQIVYDLQEEMNRHAGASWILNGLPTAVTGLLPWGTSTNPGTDSSTTIDCDEAVRALRAEEAFIELHYLVSEEFESYIPELVGQAELGSFLKWVRRTYDRRLFQELITQPNLDIVLGEEIEELEASWLADLEVTPNLIADPQLSLEWVASQPLSLLAGDPELPVSVLKEGLRLYLSGEEVAGLWEIHHALDLDPGLAVGYYTLGWIACSKDDWEEAEEQLGMALMLFEKPEEIAWCHALLSPMYLREARWDLAQASLRLIVTCSDSENIRNWAGGLLTRVGHLTALQPIALDGDSDDLGRMRVFFNEWNVAANSDSGVASLISGMMDTYRAVSLATFYSSIRETYPSVEFNHAVHMTAASGSAVLVETRVHAHFPGSTPRIPPDLEPLITDGYPLYFQVIPTENGWMVLDWEDASFPASAINLLMPGSTGMDSTEPSIPINPFEEQE